MSKQYEGEEMSKYTPGQRLNSAAEVLRALADGEKIAQPSYDPGAYLTLTEKGICDQGGYNHGLHSFKHYHIYTPPKRKVKSERWFAVMPGLWWTGQFYTKSEVEKACPNALAYVKAEVEVEVEG